MSFIDYSKFDSDYIEFHNIQFNNDLCRYELDINYKNTDLYIISPVFKVNSVNNQNIILEFMPLQTIFYEKILNMESVVLNMVYENRERIFGMDLSNSKIKSLYEPLIKLPQKLPALPYMNIKFSKDYKIYDKTNSKKDIKDIIEGVQVVCVFHIDKIFFYKNKFEINVTICFIEIVSLTPQSLEYLFID